jgi:hypothetical protein
MMVTSYNQSKLYFPPLPATSKHPLNLNLHTLKIGWTSLAIGNHINTTEPVWQTEHIVHYSVLGLEDASL